MKPLTLSITALVAGALILGASTGVIARDKPTGIVMQRIHAMLDVKNRLKDMNAMIKGRTTFLPEKIAAHAAAIERHANEIPKLFPMGSDQGKTEASPAIWFNWQVFEARAKLLAIYAELVRVAADGDEAPLRQAFKDLVKACKSCHQNFRKEK